MRKVKVINCTQTQFSYASLVGSEVDLLAEEVGFSEFAVVADKVGEIHIVSNADYEEVEENG